MAEENSLSMRVAKDRVIYVSSVLQLKNSAVLFARIGKSARNGVSANEDDYEGEGANFRRIAKPRLSEIEFIGVWDTVSSVLVPNYKGLFFPLPIKREILPHTNNNPAVKIFRQRLQ